MSCQPSLSAGSTFMDSITVELKYWGKKFQNIPKSNLEFSVHWYCLHRIYIIFTTIYIAFTCIRQCKSSERFKVYERMCLGYMQRRRLYIGNLSQQGGSPWIPRDHGVRTCQVEVEAKKKMSKIN